MVDAMEIQQARAFLAVAEELHFGRAAERIHTTQPAVSRMIRQLETDLQYPLFERSTRSVTLTPQGDALVEVARELLMLSERARDVVRQAAEGETGRLKLGFAGPSVSHLVAPLVRALRSRRLGLSLELQSAQLSQPGLERLLDRSLDVLIGRWDFLPSNIHSLVISREQLLVALPRSHRLAHRTEVAPTDLAGESWVVLPGGMGATLSNRLHVVALKGKFVPRIVQTAPDSATELLLVEAGVGVALTLSGVRENLPVGEVTFLPMSAALDTVEVRIAWHSEGRTPAVEAVIEASNRVFGAV